MFNFSERSGKERSGKRDLVKKKCYFICSKKRSGAEEGRKEGRKEGIRTKLSSLFSERSRAEESLRKIANRWQQYEIKAKIIFFLFHAVFCLQNHV